VLKGHTSWQFWRFNHWCPPSKHNNKASGLERGYRR